jgi:hypothetical protein
MKAEALNELDQTLLQPLLNQIRTRAELGNMQYLKQR